MACDLAGAPAEICNTEVGDAPRRIPGVVAVFPQHRSGPIGKRLSDVVASVARFARIGDERVAWPDTPAVRDQSFHAEIIDRAQAEARKRREVVPQSSILDPALTLPP